jgi:hypothetical protein
MQRLPISLVMQLWRRRNLCIRRVRKTLLTKPIPLHQILLCQFLHIHNLFFLAASPIYRYLSWVAFLNAAKVTAAVSVAAEQERYGGPGCSGRHGRRCVVGGWPVVWFLGNGGY